MKHTPWQKLARNRAMFRDWWRRHREGICDADRRDDLAQYVTIAEAITWTRKIEGERDPRESES